MKNEVVEIYRNYLESLINMKEKHIYKADQHVEIFGCTLNEEIERIKKHLQKIEEPS
jgi:hypothetical protein